MAGLLGSAAEADAWLARMLNRLACTHAGIRLTASACAGWLSFGEIGLMLVVGFRGQPRLAARMFLSVGLVYVACEIGGRLWKRQRPFERVADIHALVPHTAGRSLPSRHVASGLAMGMIASAGSPRLGAWMQALAYLLGLSRVMAGLHYPSDVASAVPLARLVARVLS